MKKLLVFLLAFLLSGCTYARFIGVGGKPVLVNAPVDKPYTVIAHVKKQKQIAFDYTHTVDIVDLTRDVLTDYPDAEAIINTVTSFKYTPHDFFLNLFTLFIANAKTASIEGDVIKYK